MAEVRRTVIFTGERAAHPPALAQLPPAVLSHRDLSFGAKVLFAALHAHAWPEDHCWPSQDELARDLSCTVRQVQRLLLQLRQAGLVSWKRRGLNRPNVYRLSADGCASEPPGFAKKREAIPAPPLLSPPDTTPWSELDATALSHSKNGNR